MAVRGYGEPKRINIIKNSNTRKLKFAGVAVLFYLLPLAPSDSRKALCAFYQENLAQQVLKKRTG
jgi:hypothetical protein